MEELRRLPLRNETHADFFVYMNASTARTECEVLHQMSRCASDHGFERFAIARLPIDEQLRFSEHLLLGNWPAELVRQYDAAGGFQTCPLVAQLRRTKLPVFGDTAELLNFSGLASASEPASRAMACMFAVLLHSTAGEAFVAMLTGDRSTLQRDETARLYLALVEALDTLEPTLTPMNAVRERLSDREIECLRWAAAGKSSDEIAIILGISTHTVSTYFKTGARKLDAVNRMQAIARAMRLKLI